MTSGRLTPAAATRMRTSWAAGFGTGRTAMRSCSGPPGAAISTAFISAGMTLMDSPGHSFVGQRFYVGNGTAAESRQVVSALEHRDDSPLCMAASDVHQLVGHPYVVGLDQRHAAQQVFAMGVESGGNEDHFRLEGLQRGQPLFFHRRLHRRSAASCRERYVHHVGGGAVGAAKGIEWVLEEACHEDSIAPTRYAEYIFGPVPVMDIEVDDGDAVETLDLERVGSGHGNVVEYAKTHGADARRVVTTGPHGAKSIRGTSCDYFIDGQQPSAGGAARRVEAVRVHCRVGVELDASLGGRVLENQVDVRAVMNALQVCALRQRRLEVAQLFDQPGASHARVDRFQTFRTFGMARAHVVTQTIFVSDIGGSHASFLRVSLWA